MSIYDVNGDLDALVGSPLTLAEESSSDEPEGFDRSQHDSCTWTFYRFATVKGYVDVRWLGASNGYYSESVDFAEVKTDPNTYQRARLFNKILDPRWLSSTVVDLIESCRGGKILPILGDALMDAGGDDQALVDWCHNGGKHELLRR